MRLPPCEHTILVNRNTTANTADTGPAPRQLSASYCVCLCSSSAKVISMAALCTTFASVRTRHAQFRYCSRRRWSLPFVDTILCERLSSGVGSGTWFGTLHMRSRRGGNVVKRTRQEAEYGTISTFSTKQQSHSEGWIS